MVVFVLSEAVLVIEKNSSCENLPTCRDRRGCLISLTFYLFLVILGLDPGIHFPMKVSMDAASSAA